MPSLARSYLMGLVVCTSLVLLAASSLRHALLQSSALDLAVFDQWVYLISQGLPPLSSLLGFHVLGDHAAFILYPIALLYRVWPDIHWLLLVQALALALGAIPLYGLSQQAGLSIRDSRVMALCYVLYPAIFNINFYADFRPEAIAVPSLLWALWAGVAGKTRQLIIAITLVLSCKDTLSFTVMALGLWFWLGEKRRIYGWGCLAAGAIWLGGTIGYLVPLLRNGEPGGVGFYDSLGGSLSQVALHVVTNPSLLIRRAVLPDRLFYYLLLIAPVLPGLHWRSIGVITPALPMLLLNILSDYDAQRDLVHHYSLPIFPFLLVWLARSLAHYRQRQRRNWLKARWLVAWAIVAFLALAKYEFFWTRYLAHLSNRTEVYEAIARVPPQVGVLTAPHLCPHLSHRPVIRELPKTTLTADQVQPYDVILLDVRHPGWRKSAEPVRQLKEALAQRPDFKLTYAQADVFLFAKQPR